MLCFCYEIASNKIIQVINFVGLGGTMNAYNKNNDAVSLKNKGKILSLMESLYCFI